MKELQKEIKMQTTAAGIKHMYNYSSIYCEPRFWRPTGLGNRLFSWARAKIFSEQTGCPMLSPQWAHLRGASILRGGIDYGNALRKILLFDNFHSAPEEITGFSRIILRRSCVFVPVLTLQEAFSIIPNHKKQLVSFGGHTCHVFDDLWEHSNLILKSLGNITKEKWFPTSDLYRKPFIGINVRMGNDFKKTADIKEFLSNKADYLKTPLEWYIQSLRQIRSLVGREHTAIVISDGDEHDLRTLLKESNVIFSRSKSAISDLLILQRASILIGAGRSSFSAWASFLGKMPTITIPGSDLQGYHVSNDRNTHYVGEHDPANPSESFYSAIKNIKQV